MTSTQHTVVTAAALEIIYAQARREYPKECCGLISGALGNDQADTVRPCTNQQDELHAEDPVANPRDARTAYSLGAGDLFAMGKSLRGSTPVKIVYHSHVNVGAYFSATDQAAARMGDEPTYPVEYLVVDVGPEGTRGSAQFAWDDASKTYVEVRRYP